MNTDERGPHGHDETEGMFPHLHHQENIDEHGHHVPEGDPHGHHVHVTPLLPMVGTFVALILLTILTLVTAKGLYFGNEINLAIALVIAGTKGILVAAFFMHLLYDKAMNTVITVATMFAVVLFISLTMLDIGTRDMADSLEAGEIVPGGGAIVRVDEDGNRVVSRKGEYNPWHADTPSKSVLSIARENYEAKHKHDGEHGGYGDDTEDKDAHEGEDHSGDEGQAPDAEASPEADDSTGAE